MMVNLYFYGLYLWRRKLNWYFEKLHSDFQQSIQKSKVLFKGKTKFQEVEIFENKTLGRVLIIDGIVQTSEADESNYHEMLVHVPVFSMKKVNEVLIIGGGDGGTLREVLRHNVSEVTLIELDEEIINICKEFLPSISSGAFDDSRTKVLIDNGLNYVKKIKKQFDLIIVDSTDPIGPGKVLFSKEFYSSCAGLLRKKGIFVAQNGVPFLQFDECLQTKKNISPFFIFHGFYFTSVPTYSGGMMALAWASHSKDISKIDSNELIEKIESKKLSMKYYNSNIHSGSFAMPQKYFNELN